MTLNYVCGKPDGPVPGTTVFKSHDLKRIFIDYIIVDNVNENCLKPDKNFWHDYVEGELDRSPNQWALGNKLTVVYSPCNCK